MWTIKFTPHKFVVKINRIKDMKVIFSIMPCYTNTICHFFLWALATHCKAILYYKVKFYYRKRYLTSNIPRNFTSIWATIIHKNFKNGFTYLIFRERGKEGDRERETSISYLDALQTGTKSATTGMRPHWESNQQPFTLWDNAQPTEPHQSGQNNTLFC